MRVFLTLLAVLTLVFGMGAIAALFVVYKAVPYIFGAILIWWLFKDGQVKHDV